MNANRVDAYLVLLQKREEGKLGFQHVPEGDYWRVEYRGVTPPCKFHIEIASEMLLLHARLGFEIWPHCHLSLYRFVLRLNEEMAGAKFGLSHAGELSLMVERPVGDGSFAAFASAVQLLLGCYGRYYQDLVLVAQDRELAKHIAAAENQKVRLEEELNIQLDTSGEPADRTEGAIR